MKQTRVTTATARWFVSVWLCGVAVQQGVMQKNGFGRLARLLRAAVLVQRLVPEMSVGPAAQRVCQHSG